MIKKSIKIHWFLSAVICFLIVSMSGAFPCLAKSEQTADRVTVVDDAAVLMEEEADWLKSVAMDVAEKTGWNVIAATCQDAEGKSAQEVCEENFNRYTAGDDGISCLVDLDNREIYIATAGEAISYLDDERIEKILDEAYEAVSKEDYAQCLYLMLLRTGECYDSGMVTSTTTADQDMSLIQNLGTVIGMLFGFVIVIALVVSKPFRGRTGRRQRIDRRRGIGRGQRIGGRRGIGRPEINRRHIYRNRPVNASRSSAGRSAEAGLPYIKEPEGGGLEGADDASRLKSLDAYCRGRNCNRW